MILKLLFVSNIKHRVGILGGTFDPPHLGHLALAQHFSKVLDLDQLIWIPSGVSWQKGQVLSSEHRFQMTRLLASAMAQGASGAEPGMQGAHRRPQIMVSDIEIVRSGPTYTIDTLRSLRTQLGEETAICFLMGMDQLLRLPTWHNWSSLFDYSHICVASRPGYECRPAIDLPLLLQSKLGSANLVQSNPYGTLWLDTQLEIELSSTSLRALLGKPNGDITELEQWLTPSVLDYIRQHQLYCFT